MSAGVMLAHDWFPRALPSNVSIGEASWVYSAFAFIHCRSRRSQAVRIGAHSGVYHGSFFDLGPRGAVEIGDYCTLVGAIMNTNGRVEIRDYAFLAHEVVIADDFATTPFGGGRIERSDASGTSTEESDLDAENRNAEATVVIGENAWIGARSTLLRGARIGRNAVVGAAAVVDFEVPEDAIVGGNPARIVGTVRRERRRTGRP
jgi:acetyltransferase-like isoleucine patch superfamily enzyme